VSGERILKAIDGFYKSYALFLSSGQSTRAIVFAHGFGGAPTSTWHDFHGLSEEYAKEYPWWNGATLFFYSYDSIRTPINVNAVRLREFLTVILSVPDVKVNRTSGRLKAARQGINNLWKYKNLLLVGHSEGAVVIRRMILNELEALEREGRANGLSGRQLRKWIDVNARGKIVLRAAVRLFAPACAGTNFSGALGFVHGISHFFSAIASSSLVRNELLQGSPILSGLQAGTEAAFKNHPKISALPAKILFGTEDQVVYTDKYACDEIVEPYPYGHDHFSVCKPKYTYKRPLEFVRT
jgi:hypothetical protein